MPILLDKPVGRFRKLLRENSILKDESLVLKPYLKFLESSYQKKNLEPIEIISLFVILYQSFRVKEKPFQKNPIPGNYQTMANKKFPLEFDFIPALNLETDELVDFLKMYSFRYLPTSIREVLFNAFAGEQKLFLRTDIPSSIEMLGIQANGKRYITIDFEKALSGILVDDKRDAFEFVLHDLEHAYCFFKKENEYEKQIAFYKSIEKNYSLLEPLIKESKQFKEDLEYCISDMNSHPEHLLRYFKAILIKFFLFKNNKPPDGFLTLEELSPLNELLSHVEYTMN